MDYSKCLHLSCPSQSKLNIVCAVMALQTHWGNVLKGYVPHNRTPTVNV